MAARWLIASSLVLALGLTGTAQAKPGDIIIGDSQTAEVLRLKPNGNIALVSDDARLAAPNDVVFGSNGRIYVADYGAFGDNGAVFAINPRNGNTSVLTQDPDLVQPDGIAMAPDGDLYVTDIDAGGGSLFHVAVPSGETRLISDDPLLAGAIGVVAAPDGRVFVDGDTEIVRVNPANGDVNAITADEEYNGGNGLTRGADGTLYAVDGLAQELLAIAPATGEVETVAPEAFSDGYGLGVDFAGRVLTQVNNAIYAVDPRTEENLLLSDNFGYPEGLEVEPPDCGGKTATIVGTGRKDRIEGSRFADVIATLGGNDTVKAGGGKDVVCGGDGRDKINGGGGKDRCKGQAGRDRERQC